MNIYLTGYFIQLSNLTSYAMSSIQFLFQKYLQKWYVDFDDLDNFEENITLQNFLHFVFVW